MADTINITELCQKYIRLRDKKAEIMSAAKAETAKIDVALGHAEAALLAFFNTHGMDSAGCDVGTVYKATRRSATVADWDATLDFIKGSEAWHMLEHRVSKCAVEEYIKAEGDLPPGINWREDVTVNVRRG